VIEMNNKKPQLISLAFALAPYVLLAWIYAVFVNDGMADFWKNLSVLFVLRAFFGLIEFIGAAFAWRFYRRKITIQRLVKFLQSNHLPMREYSHDDVGNYLARLADGKYDGRIKSLAIEVSLSRELMEGVGIFAGMRFNSAWEVALDIYSPREVAPQFGEQSSQSSGA
jgi:hypothetical protein